MKSQENALGVSTVGSSEAIILAVLAAKRKWQNARRAAGKSVEKPNLVMNAAVHGMFRSILPSVSDMWPIFQTINQFAGRRQLVT